ncbi:antitoxin VapB family protein [archaeon]|nr:antitoxin VapB family protein [archaeon]
MTVKTITVTEEAYTAFARMKSPGESFSELMKRVSNTHPTVSDICGVLKDKIDFEHLRKRTKEVHERMGKSMEERHARLRQFGVNRSS